MTMLSTTNAEMSYLPAASLFFSLASLSLVLLSQQHGLLSRLLSFLLSQFFFSLSQFFSLASLVSRCLSLPAWLVSLHHSLRMPHWRELRLWEKAVEEEEDLEEESYRNLTRTAEHEEWTFGRTEDG